jgi:hypothetical protein
MPWLTDAARNTMLDALAGQAGFVSLHSAYPDATGSNEVTGAPYARQAVTWNPAAAGGLDNNANPSFNLPALTTVAWFGLFDAATAGTFLTRLPIGSTVVRPFQATTADVFTSAAHGFTDGSTVVLMDTDGASLPTGVVEGTEYFVRDATADTFKLALTSGGVAIDLTAAGAGFAADIATETFTGAGGVLNVGDLDVFALLG